jgi:hypothetical protein
MMQHQLEQHRYGEESHLTLIALRLQLLDWLETPVASDNGQTAPPALTVSDWERFAVKLQQLAYSLAPAERRALAALLREVSSVPAASS